MTILAVDDERLALDALKNELKTVFPHDEIHAEQDPETAIGWVRQQKENGNAPTYAFLDIQMGPISGLELARRLKLICPGVVLFFCTAYSQYAYDAFGLCAKGYLLKPVSAKDIERVLDEMVTNWRGQPTPLERDIRVQTFGRFEVFVDGKPLAFEREKAKELMAYLVDLHGASATTEQIAMLLWEDAPYDRKRKNMTTTVVASLRRTLKEADAEDILIKTWNHLAVDPAKIKCDAYDYEQGDAVAVNSFRGEYMSNYSWAEFTTGKYIRMETEKSDR